MWCVFELDCVNFVYVCNIKLGDGKLFKELVYLLEYGLIDMYEVIKLCYEFGFEGVIWFDYGCMIWGEIGCLGYGLYDRVLGVIYFFGLYEVVIKGLK